MTPRGATPDPFCSQCIFPTSKGVHVCGIDGHDLMPVYDPSRDAMAKDLDKGDWSALGEILK